MSIITKLSPKKRLFGMMMGLWFLASAFGQLAAGKLGAEISQSNTGSSLLSKLQSYTDGYYQLAIRPNCRFGINFDISFSEKINARSSLIL